MLKRCCMSAADVRDVRGTPFAAAPRRDVEEDLNVGTVVSLTDGVRVWVFGDAPAVSDVVVGTGSGSAREIGASSVAHALTSTATTCSDTQRAAKVAFRR